MNYRDWALDQLGLAGPELRSQLEKWRQEKDPTAELVKAVKRRGRVLLGKYHPDRHGGSEEAVLRFRAINEVLQTLDDMPLPQPEPDPPPQARVRTTVSFYPERGPYSGAVETKTVHRSYFDFKNDSTTTQARLRYDARKVVPMKPK